ncbi:MAG: NAD(P)-binding domain-containing protein, partial [Candidatus Methanomethylophilus sp.]|nr:NAD(P)-binding domain-containing protein [Methanomethylophilus sp.]
MGAKIGFIGAGKMAAAMIEGLLAKGLYSKDEIVACCKSQTTK